jgi:hypothetical protein
VEPGINGGFQGTVKSPMNKGRVYGIPGIGLAGDWPGGWTQTYAQMDTEAGAQGFDQHYFVQQVAGLSQLAAEFMLVDPMVIDLGWGKLKSALANLKYTGFAASHQAGEHRRTLVGQYVSTFRQVEAAAREEARSAIRELMAGIANPVATEQQGPVRELVDRQLAKLG